MAAHDCTIAVATDADLGSIIEIQHEAFRRTAHELDYDISAMPPLAEGETDLRTLRDSGTVFFKATAPDGRIVAAVRATPGPEDRVEIGRLVVTGGWERRGLARDLMSALEAAFPPTVRFELFTGAEHDGAVRLYERLGYTVTRFETAEGGIRLVWMGKAPRG